MIKKILLIILLPVIVSACKVSYSFNGASIDYNIIRTIQIHDFENQALMVYAPLTQQFNEQIRDHFTRNTKLRFTDVDPDIEFEGEFIRYDFTPQSVGEDAFAQETRFTIGIRVRYKNNRQPEKDRDDLVFTAFRDFNSNSTINEAQDQLIPELNKELIDQIFNTTMSDW